MKSLMNAVLLAAFVAAPVLAQTQSKPNPGQGLAIGQNQKLLQMTRDSNAGAGNGGEFVVVKRSFSIIGCNPHDMASCFKTTYAEIDPGNSGSHNESPECAAYGCTFDPSAQ